MDEKTYYRQCFDNPVGRIVLTDILINAGYFDNDLETTDEVAVENFAKGILYKSGIYDKKLPDQCRSVVDRMFDIPVSLKGSLWQSLKQKLRKKKSR